MALPTLNYVSCADADGGHRMAYWSWGDPAAPRVIVCVHGLSRQGRDFDVLAQALLARSEGRLRVVCPDVVGRGRSDWLKNPQGYVLPTYAADMLALLAQLHAQAPVQDLSWCGTSMGGLIGMAVAGTPSLPLPTPIQRPAAQRCRPGHPVAGHRAHRRLPRPDRPLRDPAGRRRCDVAHLQQLRPPHARAVAGAVAGDGARVARRRPDAALRPGHRACRCAA